MLRALASDGTPVVLKLARGGMTSRPVARLFHEYAVLRELSDAPGVVHACALEPIEGVFTLVLEAPTAQSLASLLSERSKLSVEETLALGVALAQALDGVHQAGVVHKDVKPHEIPSEAEQQ